MTQQEILNANFSKTEKARRLFELGFTRRQVADLLMNGNVGFAYNVWKKWNEEQTEQITALPFEFSFSRTFGIELEVYGVSRDRILTEMRRLGIQVEGEAYNHNTRNHWKIVSDSSIHGANGNEIVSPVLSGVEGMEQVKKVCLALNRAGAKVNTSCGFHAHFGANDLSILNFKNLFLSYIELEAKMDEIMPESRRRNNNTYCKSLTSIANSKAAAIAKIKNAPNHQRDERSILRKPLLQAEHPKLPETRHHRISPAQRNHPIQQSQKLVADRSSPDRIRQAKRSH